MTVTEKKAMVIELIAELRNELTEDEQMFFACSFNEPDVTATIMSAHLAFIGSALLGVCEQKSMPVEDTARFLDALKRAYIAKTTN